MLRREHLAALFLLALVALIFLVWEPKTRSAEALLVDTWQPALNFQPSEPLLNSEPAKPSQDTQPAAKSSKDVLPTKPPQDTQPSKSFDDTEPANTSQGTFSARPSSQDSQPANRSRTTQPSKPSQGSQPEKSSQGSQPAKSQRPKLTKAPQDSQSSKISKDTQPTSTSQNSQVRKPSQDNQSQNDSHDSQLSSPSDGQPAKSSKNDHSKSSQESTPAKASNTNPQEKDQRARSSVKSQPSEPPENSQSVKSDQESQPAKFTGKRQPEQSNQQYTLHSPSFTAQGRSGGCRSVTEAYEFYRRGGPVPSPALLDHLRKYEAMHRRCVMGVSDWSSHFHTPEAGLEDCKYLVNMDSAVYGLGNRFGSIVSALEYALLTNRALLITTSRSMNSLLCNMFEGSSAWASGSLPWEQIKAAPHHRTLASPKNHSTNANDLPKVLSVVLNHEWTTPPDFFIFCPAIQNTISKITWVTWEASQFTLPGFFLIPKFKEHLLKLFPDHQSTLHMARYLLLPVDSIWDRIVKSRNKLFGGKVETVGLQIRTPGGYNPNVTEYILQCAVQHGGLPTPPSMAPQEEQVNRSKSAMAGSSKQFSILVTSLSVDYFDQLRITYPNKTAADGSQVRFSMESHEGEEDHGPTQNENAFAEMWLLSFTDTLYLSDSSTFGYVAHALGGWNNSYFLIIRWAAAEPTKAWEARWQEPCVHVKLNNACFHIPPPTNIECPIDQLDDLPASGKSSQTSAPDMVQTCQDRKSGLNIY